LSVAIMKLENVIEEFRKLDTEIQAQAMMALCVIARGDEANSPVTVKEIGEKLGLTSASASRNVAILSKWNRHQVKGHDLVEAYENPARRVEKFVRLTPKGKRVIKSLETIINGNKT